MGKSDNFEFGEIEMRRANTCHTCFSPRFIYSKFESTRVVEIFAIIHR